MVTEGSSVTSTSYAGNYVYKEDSAGETLQFFNHSEGYVEPDASGYNYVYQYKDHLGNIRLSYDLDETNSIIINEDYSGLIYNWQTPNDINTTYYNLNNETLNFTSTEKWRSISKYVDFAPNETIHIEFDFEKGTMVNPILFVREKINGVWESNADRDRFELTDGHFEVDLNLQGDHIRIYFEKGAGSDEGIPTTSHIDNLIITQNILEVVEENNYYPFGLKHNGYNNVVNGTDYPYGFIGKEEQNEFNNSLQWLDFGARNYDAALGRWMNLDPLAEEMRRHSPYNYAFDNPIFFIDPDGMKPFSGGKKEVLHSSTTASNGTTNYKRMVSHKGAYGGPKVRNYDKKGFTFNGAGRYHEHAIPVSSAKSNFSGSKVVNSSIGRKGVRAGLFSKSPDYTEKVQVTETSVSGQYYNADGDKVSSIDEATSLVVTTNTTVTSVDLEGSFNTQLAENATITSSTATTTYDISSDTGVSGEPYQLINEKTSQTTPTIETVNFHDVSNKDFKKYAIGRVAKNSSNMGKQFNELEQAIEGFVKEAEDLGNKN